MQKSNGVRSGERCGNSVGPLRALEYCHKSTHIHLASMMYESTMFIDRNSTHYCYFSVQL